jgi:hypothetical protein
VSLLYFRWLLLALSGFALLTGIAMHGLVCRLLLPRVMDASQSQSGVSSHALRLFSVMIGRAWIFRIYHLCFAALFLTAWWYLGTTAGNVVWTQLMSRS